MSLDKDTKSALANIEGVAAFSEPADKTDGLRVILLTDTPEVRQAVLGVVGDRLPAEKITFESNELIEQCSFCGKLKNKARVMLKSTFSVLQDKVRKFPICICDACVAHCAEVCQNQPSA